MTVSARELHEKLEIRTAFKDWFPRMCEYGFAEGEDFNMLKNERVQIEGNREVKREITDYEISIDMAKQICMIQRSEIDMDLGSLNHYRGNEPDISTLEMMINEPEN